MKKVSQIFKEAKPLISQSLGIEKQYAYYFAEAIKRNAEKFCDIAEKTINMLNDESANRASLSKQIERFFTKRTDSIKFLVEGIEYSSDEELAFCIITASDALDGIVTALAHYISDIDEDFMAKIIQDLEERNDQMIKDGTIPTPLSVNFKI